jgi:hypothetical protein
MFTLYIPEMSVEWKIFICHTILSKVVLIQFIVSLTVMITLCYTFIYNYEVHNIRITQLP